MKSELDSQRVLDRLYPASGEARGREERARERESRARQRRLRIRRWAVRLQRHLWKVGFLSALVLVWIVLHVYYYNKLVDMDTGVQVAWAQVETQLQRRHNVQTNLTLLRSEYAKHERTLHERLTRIRTAADAAGRPVDPGPTTPSAAGQPSAPAAAGKAPTTRQQLEALFPNIRMVAEQYPHLRLSENFHQFSEAIVDTENKIAAQIMKYNDAVNRMAAALRQVPGNIFGPVCGFKIANYHLYQPERKTQPFRRVDHEGR